MKDFIFYNQKHNSMWLCAKKHSNKSFENMQKCRDFFFLGYNIHEKMLRDAAPITKEQELSAALDETERN